MVPGVVESIDEYVRAYRQQHAQANGQESESVLPCVEAVDRLEGKRVRCEESKKHRERKRGV